MKTLIASIAFVVFALLWVFGETYECEEKDGVYIVTASGYKCINV